MLQYKVGDRFGCFAGPNKIDSWVLTRYEDAHEMWYLDVTYPDGTSGEGAATERQINMWLKSGEVWRTHVSGVLSFRRKHEV